VFLTILADFNMSVTCLRPECESCTFA